MEDSWTYRHWRWVHEELHPCKHCEDPRDRGFDRPLADDRWARLVLACAGRWHGLVQRLLPGRSRDLGGRFYVWDDPASPAPSSDPSPAAPLDPFGLRRLALDYEWRLDAATTRGPVQSVPAWHYELDELSTALSAAWARWADAVFDPFPLSR